MFLFLSTGTLIVFGAAKTTPHPPKPKKSEMMDAAKGNIARIQAAQLPTAGTAAGCFDGVRKLSEERRTAQRVIGAQYPLDDFAGIVLSDQYDEMYLAAVDTLTASFLRLDADLPDPEAATAFRGRLSDIPKTNEKPFAFMVAYIVMRCVQAGLNPPASLPPELKSDYLEAAVRTAAEFDRLFQEGHRGAPASGTDDDTWQATVMGRVRCSQHRTGYTIREIRNGMRNGSEFYRRYVASCDGGQESRNFDFDLEELNRFTRSGGLQKLPPRLPNPTSRQPGVDQ